MGIIVNTVQPQNIMTKLYLVRPRHCRMAVCTQLFYLQLKRIFVKIHSLQILIFRNLYGNINPTFKFQTHMLNRFVACYRYCSMSPFPSLTTSNVSWVQSIMVDATLPPYPPSITISTKFTNFS